MSRWTDADSDDLDQRIKAMRKPDALARPAPTNKGVNTAHYDGTPRGEANTKELQRRRQVERAMRRRAQREGEQ